MTDKKKNPTSADVARLANVSRATVSYVLNDRKDKTISEEVRKRIFNAAAEIGYHANSAAVSLVSGKSDVIGFVSSDSFELERIWKTVEGIRRTLQKDDKHLLLCSKKIDESGVPEYVRQYLKGSIDGIIFLVSEVSDNPDFNIITKFKIPCVVIDAHDDNLDFPTVDVDYYHGAMEVLRHLKNCGYHSFYYLTMDVTSPRETERQQALKDFIAANDNISLTVNKVPLEIYNNEWPFEQVRDEIVDITRGYKIDAMDVAICSVPFYVLISKYVSDRLERQFVEKGLVSLGDRQEFRYFHPGVSASSIPWYKVGEKAVALMIDSLQGKPAGHEKINPELIIRDSTKVKK